MNKLIIANWKMLPDTLAQAEEIIGAIDESLQGRAQPPEFDLVVCPPFIFIEDIGKKITQGSLVAVAQLGAQDIAAGPEVAQTGEVSGEQLVRLGVRYVIIGHSERRWKLGEDDATVNAKLKAALADGLVPIVCLGERTRQDNWQGELAAQVTATFAGLTAGQVAQCLVAYEPVWAISTNPGAHADTPASAVQAMGIIRDTFVDHFDVSKPTFIYGGSVTPKNAEEFLARPEVSAVLVGSASVRVQEFLEILSIATSLH